jgi:hypothetical protein
MAGARAAIASGIYAEYVREAKAAWARGETEG